LGLAAGAAGSWRFFSNRFSQGHRKRRRNLLYPLEHVGFTEELLGQLVVDAVEGNKIAFGI
jgi:hypothetical protein